MQKHSLCALIASLVQIIGAVEIAAGIIGIFLGVAGHIEPFLAVCLVAGAFTCGLVLLLAGQVAEVLIAIAQNTAQPMPRAVSRSDREWQRMVEQQNAL